MKAFYYLKTLVLYPRSVKTTVVFGSEREHWKELRRLSRPTVLFTRVLDETVYS
jgi:hypothetical protein